MHTAVLLQEVIDGLRPQAGETILDATVGDGGHSLALCAAMAGSGRIVCLDEDEDALARSRARLRECRCVFLFYRTNFRHLDVALRALKVSEIDRAVFDLGLSAWQLEGSGKGFSFRRDEPLRMTFGLSEGGVTAREIVNTWDEHNIAAIIRGFGQERQAERIARAITAARRQKPIETSAELAGLILQAVRGRGRVHPATKTFQALRIAVNDELGALTEALPQCLRSLRAGGRMAVISFHSLEDRIVKRFFREKGAGVGRVITPKPMVPSRAEIAANPRARSAKLRIFEKEQ